MACNNAIAKGIIQIRAESVQTLAELQAHEHGINPKDLKKNGYKLPKVTLT